MDFDLDNDDDNAHDLIVIHSTQTAIAQYGRLGRLIQKLTLELIDIFRSISDRWQEWYIFMLILSN